MAPTIAWFGAALTPVAELTKPTLMVPPPAAAGDPDDVGRGASEPPQPPRTMAAPTMTVSANSATAIHLRLLIDSPFYRFRALTAENLQGQA